MDAEAIARNPTIRVPTPRIEPERPWVLTMEEVDGLVEAVPERYPALRRAAATASRAPVSSGGSSGGLREESGSGRVNTIVPEFGFCSILSYVNLAQRRR
jgi:hypothetical protein